MTRLRMPAMLLVVNALVFHSAPLSATGAAAGTTAGTTAAGDAAAGQQKSELCQGCHGLDGNSYGPEWPNLASQHPSYLIKQIRDYQSGTRENETMTPMVSGLDDQDIRDITAYFSVQALAAEPVAPSPTGKKLYLGGNTYNRVPACAGCHGASGGGNAPGAIPRLGGQKTEYTAKTLREFRAGVRHNDRNNIMAEIAARLSDTEITALAEYIAGLGQQ